MKNIFALTMAFLYASAAFAEADLNPNIFNVPATNSGTTATREIVSPGTTGTKAAGVPVMTGSINPGAKEGKDSQKGGSGANAAIGAALMAAGAAMMASPPTIPPGVALMAMGMLAMMQSKEDSGAANESAATGMASNVNDGKLGTPTDPTGSSAFADAKIKEGQAKLAEAGYKMTSKGLTAPDGTFTPAKAFDSPSSMAASGMSPSSIAAVQAALADAQGGAMNGARVSSVGVNSGGGGGLTEGDSNGSSASDSGNSNPFGLGADQKRSMVAGKTVMFDGEPIGVRGQNIFDMVHTAYQKKRDGKHFIEGEVDVSTRMPASVKPSRK